MRILAIETSCDETAAALLSFSEEDSTVSYTVLGEVLHSQTDLHARYGGVYPHAAKREHQKLLPPLVHSLLSDLSLLRDAAGDITPDISSVCAREPVMLAQLSSLFAGTAVSDIDAIAVTQGPGLSPALWVGVNFARALSLLWDMPLIPVNHMEGHIVSALVDDSHRIVVPTLPLLALLVSGGHTELVLSKEDGVYEKIGQTLDDAAGEAFDKGARLLGLPYPGGSALSDLAARARAAGISSPVSLPRPVLKDHGYSFSYAGLKTALRVFLEKHPTLSDDERLAVACEFETAIVETLIEKTRRALEEHSPQTLVVGGGVSANTYLRKQLSDLVSHYPSVTLHLPTISLATDNAIMIALAAFVHRHHAVSASSLAADSNLSFPAAG